MLQIEFCNAQCTVRTVDYIGVNQREVGYIEVVYSELEYSNVE